MPPKGGDNQLLDDAAFGDSRRRRSSKYAAEHEHAVMSGRGDRESDRGEKRQPRRRASEDKARAAQGDDDDGEVPATLSFTPTKHEKAYYEGLFHAATSGARRRGHSSDEIARAGISVNDASRFLALSGLPANHLQVMISTARSGVGRSSRGAGSNPLEMLSKTDFFVAVRLVQLRQNHCRVTDLDLNVVKPEDGSEMKPPHFKGVSDVSVPLPGSAKESGVKKVRSASHIADLLNDGLPETELGRETTWPPEDQTDRRSSMRRSGSSQKLVTSGMEEIGHDSFNSRQSNRSTKEKDRSSKDNSSRRDPSSRDHHGEKARGRRRSDALDERRMRSHSASKLRDSTRQSARSRSGSGDGLRRKVRSVGHLEEYDYLSSDSEDSTEKEIRKRRDQLGRPSRPERGLKKSGSSGRLDKLERGNSKRDKDPRSCCRACKERSEEISKMVLKMWEMEKEMGATMELVKELKAEVKALRKEARDRDLMLDLEKKDEAKRMRRKLEKMRVSSKSKLKMPHDRSRSNEKAKPKERMRSYSADKIREFANLGIEGADSDDSDEQDGPVHERGFSSDERMDGDLIRSKGSKSERSLGTTKHDNLAPSTSFHGREDNDSDDQLLGQGMLDIMNKYNNSMDLSQEVERPKMKRRNSGSLLGKLKDRARRTSIGGKGGESMATGATGESMPFDASNPRSVMSGFDDNKSFASSRW